MTAPGSLWIQSTLKGFAFQRRHAAEKCALRLNARRVVERCILVQRSNRQRYFKGNRL
jgi:hypothetical protein